MKVYLAKGWNNYANWLKDAELVSNFDDADLVMFEGGTDVNPELYNEPRGEHTDRPDITRDAHEKELFERAVKAGKKILGVCRGLSN